MNPILTSKKAFTLIELLIVTGILAVLAAILVIILNPPELLAQSRDGTRLSDLNNINTALGIVQVNSVSLGAIDTVYVSVPDTSPTCADLNLPTLISGWSYACVNATSSKSVNGNGWIPINFNLVSSGSPLPILPIDPVNSTSTNNYYTYSTNGSSWLVQALAMESSKFKGSYPSGYELGTFSGPGLWRKNWVTNPSFESTAFWTSGALAGSTSGLTNALQSSNYQLTGNYSDMEQSAGSTGQYYLSNSGAFSPVIGDTYTLSAYVYVPAGSPITTIKIGIRDWTTYNFLSSTVASVTAGSWIRLSTTYTATVANPQWRLTLSDPGGALTTGNIGTYYVDDVLLEQSSSMGSYLDGSTTGFFWDGTPNQSTSEN